jgi:signal transduction histidine kinase
MLSLAATQTDAWQGTRVSFRYWDSFLSLSAGMFRASVVCLKGRIGFMAGKLSLTSRGVCAHFGISVVLISVIPFLTLYYIIIADSPAVARWLAVLFATPLVFLGYFMMSTYPRALIQLRDYLRRIINGEMPESVHLVRDEPDLIALERCLNLLIEDMKKKIQTIENQKKLLIEIERKNAVTASLATACHYIGQPTTVLTAYLEMMSDSSMTVETRNMLAECKKAAGRIADILYAFNSMGCYGTEPYIGGETTANSEQHCDKLLIMNGA